jgi:hypothetical protein
MPNRLQQGIKKFQYVLVDTRRSVQRFVQVSANFFDAKEKYPEVQLQCSFYGTVQRCFTVAIQFTIKVVIETHWDRAIFQTNSQ